jgi:large subunit ribosomal protein L20
MEGLKKAEIALDRKILSELAVADPAGFATLVTQARNALEV